MLIDQAKTATTAKSGTTPPHINTQPNPLQQLADGDSNASGAPPSYADSTGLNAGSPPSSRSQPQVLKPPLSHARMLIANGGINETFILDPSSKHPYLTTGPSNGPGKGKPFPPEEAISSAYIWSGNGSVKCQFVMKDTRSGDKARGKCKIEAHSNNGSVRLEVLNDSSSPFEGPLDISISSKNGQVSVAVPPNFAGPITYKLGNGKFIPAPSLSSRVVIWHVDNNIGTGKIVSRAGSGRNEASGATDTKDRLEGDEGEGEGSDSLEIASSNGSSYLYDEFDEKFDDQGPRCLTM